MKRQSGMVATLEELVILPLSGNHSEGSSDILARIETALAALVAAGQSYWEISNAKALFSAVNPEDVHSLANAVGIKLVGRLPYLGNIVPEEAAEQAFLFAAPYDTVILSDFCRYDPCFAESLPPVSRDKKSRKAVQPASTAAVLTEEAKALQEQNAAVLRAIRVTLKGKELYADDAACNGNAPLINRLLSENGLGCCRVLEKGFEGRDPHSRHLPHNYPQGCVAYLSAPTGEGIECFLYHGNPLDVGFAVDYLNLSEREGYAFGFIRGLLACPAALALINAKDFIASGEIFDEKTQKRLKYYTKMFGRC